MSETTAIHDWLLKNGFPTQNGQLQQHSNPMREPIPHQFTTYQTPNPNPNPESDPNPQPAHHFQSPEQSHQPPQVPHSQQPPQPLHQSLQPPQPRQPQQPQRPQQPQQPQQPPQPQSQQRGQRPSQSSGHEDLKELLRIFLHTYMVTSSHIHNQSIILNKKMDILISKRDPIYEKLDEIASTMDAVVKGLVENHESMKEFGIAFLTNTAQNPSHPTTNWQAQPQSQPDRKPTTIQMSPPQTFSQPSFPQTAFSQTSFPPVSFQGTSFPPSDLDFLDMDQSHAGKEPDISL